MTKEEAKTMSRLEGVFIRMDFIQATFPDTPFRAEMIAREHEILARLEAQKEAA